MSIYLSCVSNSPRLCAYLIKVSLNTPKKLKKSKYSNNKVTIILYRAIGMRDVEIISNLSNKLPKLLVMDRYITKLILYNFLKGRKIFFNYWYAPVSEKEYFNQNETYKKKHNLFWTEVIFYLKKYYRGKSLNFITFNWKYFAETALYEGCKNNSVAVKLWAKESLQSDLDQKHEIKHDEFKDMLKYFKKIAVYNNLTKKKFIKMDKTTSGKIILGGCPRMLDFISSKKEKKIVKNILFLSFSSTNGIPPLKENRLLNWHLSYNKVIKILNEFAENKKLNIVIKRKNKFVYKTNLKINNKIKVYEDGHANAFVNNADIIITQNSGATIDSLVNGKIVMVPFFEKKNMKKFLYNFNKEIIYTSEEGMKKKIKSLIGKKISFPLKKQNHNKTIEYYYGKPAKVVERYVGFLNS